MVLLEAPVRIELKNKGFADSESHENLHRLYSRRGCPAMARAYQLNCNFKFISGWPPILDVRWSALILPKVFGFR